MINNDFPRPRLYLPISLSYINDTHAARPIDAESVSETTPDRNYTEILLYLATVSVGISTTLHVVIIFYMHHGAAKAGKRLALMHCRRHVSHGATIQSATSTQLDAPPYTLGLHSASALLPAPSAHSPFHLLKVLTAPAESPSMRAVSSRLSSRAGGSACSSARLSRMCASDVAPGITTTPCCTAQRSSTRAVLTLRALAIDATAPPTFARLAEPPSEPYAMTTISFCWHHRTSSLVALDTYGWYSSSLNAGHTPVASTSASICCLLKLETPVLAAAAVGEGIGLYCHASVHDSLYSMDSRMSSSGMARLEAAPPGSWAKVLPHAHLCA